MRTNAGRVLAAFFVGLVAAVMVRGVSGCSSGEAGETDTSAAVQAAQETVQPEVDMAAIPEGIVDLENEICPVMGGRVAEGQYVDWNGYRVHFCCAGCDSRFLSDPEAYLEVLSEDPRIAEILDDGTRQ